MNWKEFRGNQKNKRVRKAYLWGKVDDLQGDWRRPHRVGKAGVNIHLENSWKNAAADSRSVIFPLVSWKIMEKNLIEAVSKHVKDENVFGSRQQRFTKAKVCLTDCLLWYHWFFVMGGGSGAIYLELSKAFDIVSHSKSIA